ncbi:MAG TPA: hypothetical protein VK194_06640 [Candidatus Deferrimicrobium sp.]|nr:hypothetical protein [Candidatus Deferrimicrobium sp.]
MRHSNHTGRGRRLPIWAVGLFALIAAACGSTNGAPQPSVAPTPSPTPDPHLSEPVTADQVYKVFFAAKVKLQCPNANLGNGNPRIVKQINCTLDGWPLRIIQYKSAALLTDALKWQPGDAPVGDQPPYAWAGLNVLIQLGPISARAPSAPDSARQATASSLFAILDPLLWPIAQHSVVAVAGRTPIPVATPEPSAAPSAKPAKTPKPSKAP